MSLKLYCWKSLEPSLCPSPSWIALNTFGCITSGISPISSRNNVPPLASSNSPLFAISAPVNAPFSWPKNWLSAKLSGIVAQLTGKKVEFLRSPYWWIIRAINSFPVPFSPCTRTFTGDLLTILTISSTSLIAGLSAIIETPCTISSGKLPTSFPMESAIREISLMSTIESIENDRKWAISSSFSRSSLEKFSEPILFMSWTAPDILSLLRLLIGTQSIL